MTDNKFKNKYRIQSARAQWWDYGNNAAYFITICTANREHYFGNIINEKMHLSSIGVIANVFWHEIKKHTHFIKLGEFIVMPNHIHGILIIDKPFDDIDNNIGTDNVETRHALSLQPQFQSANQQSFGQKRFQNQGKNTISSIIGGYKSVVSNHIHRLGYNFKWQTRFYEHIIRNEQSYQHITDYITNNPKNWENDKFYTE